MQKFPTRMVCLQKHGEVLTKNPHTWVLIAQRLKGRNAVISLSMQDCKVSRPNISDMVAKD